MKRLFHSTWLLSWALVLLLNLLFIPRASALSDEMSPGKRYKLTFTGSDYSNDMGSEISPPDGSPHNFNSITLEVWDCEANSSTPSEPAYRGELTLEDTDGYTNSVPVTVYPNSNYLEGETVINPGSEIACTLKVRGNSYSIYPEDASSSPVLGVSINHSGCFGTGTEDFKLISEENIDKKCPGSTPGSGTANSPCVTEVVYLYNEALGCWMELDACPGIIRQAMPGANLIIPSIDNEEVGPDLLCKNRVPGQDNGCGASTCSDPCGYCSTFDFMTNTLYIPCFAAGEEQYWLKFLLLPGNTPDSFLFGLGDYGIRQ